MRHRHTLPSQPSADVTRHPRRAKEPEDSESGAPAGDSHEGD